MNAFIATLTMAQQLVLLYYVLANASVFIVYALDKFLAQRGGRRVSETTLMLLAFIGGGFGALLSMVAFHHKTAHRKFYVGVPVLSLVNLVIYVYCFALFYTVRF